MVGAQIPPENILGVFIWIGARWFCLNDFSTIVIDRFTKNYWLAFDRFASLGVVLAYGKNCGKPTPQTN
jgi:hypothetical protein